MAVGDFNGDGHLDLVVTGSNDYGNNTVSILLGNGDGTFQAAQSFVLPQGAGHVAVGDFNGDGVLDLVVTNYGPATVSIFLGNGDGAFQGAQSYGVGARPRHVTAADLNGDGILDLAVGVEDGVAVSILLGNGDGTFHAPRSYMAGLGPRVVVVGDFNGDGIPDLAVSNYGHDGVYDAGVSILRGNGDGTFQAAQGLPNTRFGSLAVGDFNRDGRLDLALCDGRDVNIFLGKGDGTFGIPVLYAASYAPGPIVIADFNGDGVLDLAVASQVVVAPQPSDTVSVLLGNGDGTFQAARCYGSGGRTMAMGDFNGDGIPDLAVANYSGVSILLGNGDGTFQTAQGYPVGEYSQFVAVGDFNGDGIPDLVTANADSNTVSILLGNGDGTFQAPHTFAAGNGPISVAVGDFNGDGKLDIVTTNFAVVGDPRHVQVIENGVRLFLGNGDGTFQAGQTYAISPSGSRPSFVAVGDFNGDGTPDLVVANVESGALSILLGKGDGTFAVARNVGVGATPASVAVADFNGDGHLDLCVAQEGNYADPGTVKILLGNGDGTFQTAQGYAVGTHPYSIAVGDINRDGILDLAVADFSGVSILLGNGDGTFQAHQSYPAGSGGFLVVADLNGDGFPDLALSTSVTILLNKP